jgi:putative transposase
MLCEICGVSRSGFYKWRGRDEAFPQMRTKILKLVQECHDAHPSHGYRWVHAYLVKRNNIGVSADYIRRCFRYLGISAKTKHRPKEAKRTSRETYPNLIFTTWETIDRPRQVIVSDMTAFWTRDKYFELALYFDVFTKQIIGHGLTKRRGWPGIYYDGLNQTIKEVNKAKECAVGALEKGCGEICVIHTDQGSVYTSKAYNEIIKENNIVRSCSRAGKPTDNPVNESLNGWIKEELFVDFNLYDATEWEVPQLIEDYISWYNEKRPCWSLGYKTPNEFFEEYLLGNTERKNTFANRVLDDTPKFVKEKLKRAEESAKSNAIGTSDVSLQ